MNFLIAIQLAVLGFSLAAPLGPVNMEIIKQAFQRSRGFIFSMITGIGAMSADFVIAMSVFFIGTEVLQSLIENNLIKFTLFMLNASILGFIGISALKNDPQNVEFNENVIETQAFRLPIFRQYIIGFVLVTTSPWSYLWWISFGPFVLSLDIPLEGVGDKALAAGMFLVGIFAWVLLFSTVLATSNAYASRKFVKFVTKVSAGLILVFAIRVLYDAVNIFV